jgi:uncharacterized protein
MAQRTDSLDDGLHQPLRLLVLQPTPFCNIDCSYCYLSSRKSTARMSLDTVRQASRRIFESSHIGRSLEVAWHGGEPLTVPLPWYREAIALMDEFRPEGVQLKHRFQTNGLLLDEEWAEFFSGIGAKIGLSIDGPADLHDASRRTRSGHGTQDKVMRAVGLLHQRDFPFHVITVLTEHALEDPDRLFDFYAGNGIREVGFNVEEIEGANRKSSLSGPDVATRFRHFIRRFFELVLDHPEVLQLREFENAIGLLLSDEQIEDEQNTPFRVVSIGHDGTMSTFSPELLGAHHSRFNGFSFGNVARDGITEMEGSSQFRLILDEIRRGVEACERSCPYFRWCGGGAPANKLFELGRFDGTETLHCRLTRQVMLDEAISALEARIAS